MHSCPDCQELCDCDGEDHYMEILDLDDCMHGCEADPDAPEFEELEADSAGPTCRVCGCSEFNACPGGCVWATPDLCSRCVG